jgi:hypothetical protein
MCFHNVSGAHRSRPIRGTTPKSFSSETNVTWSVVVTHVTWLVVASHVTRSVVVTYVTWSLVAIYVTWSVAVAHEPIQRSRVATPAL